MGRTRVTFQVPPRLTAWFLDEQEKADGHGRKVKPTAIVVRALWMLYHSQQEKIRKTCNPS